MNNFYLNNRSENFLDDRFEQVEKRCFFLLCGKQNMDCAISIDVQVNLFDDPRKQKKNLQFTMVLDQFVIEYNNEILKNLTNLALEFRIANNFTDLHPAPGPSKFNKKKNLWRMIEMQAPLYVIKKQILRRTMEGNFDEAIKKYHEQFLKNKEESKPHELKQKEQKDKQVKMLHKIRVLDKALHVINFDVQINLRKIYLGLTGEKEDYLTQNQTLLEVGIDNQSIDIVKSENRCKASVFGASVTTLNSFDMLFLFANKLQKVAKVYTDNLAVQTSIDHYKEMIKTIKTTRIEESKTKGGPAASQQKVNQQKVEFGKPDIMQNRGQQQVT